MVLRAPIADLLDTVLPARCPGCSRRGAPVCRACAANLVAAPFAPPPPPILWWTSCFAYAGVARELVARAKYRGARRFLAFVARELAAAVAEAPAEIDAVTWAPASAPRIRAQGIDHGEMLARELARLTGAPVGPRLVRGPGSAQTGLDARTRALGPPLRATASVAGATILVVDDVATTGGTLAAAGRALHERGARAVFAATVARTPRPGDRREAAAYTPFTATAFGPPQS